MISIAVDGIGGDHAPVEIVKGAIQAIREFPIQVILLGPEHVLQKECHQQKANEFLNSGQLVIQDAPEVVGMSESPSVSFRKKKNSSIQIGLNLVKEGRAQAFVSAGNTGAVLAASTFILGRIEHVDRPSLASIIPSQFGPFVMCDVGSNVDCKPSHLSQFALMASHFAELVLGIKNPRVSLLNIGEEEDKGNAACLEAYKEIQALPLNFIGNIEGKDILFSKSDVVVCDGFVGNSVLKFGEGAEALFSHFFKQEAKRSLRSLIGLLLLKSTFMKFKKLFDYAEHGGAPLLGVNGVSVVAHGKSNARAIKNAIRIALQTHESKMVEKIQENMALTIQKMEAES